MKDSVSVDYLMESMTPTYLEDYGEVEKTTFYDREFAYVRGYEPTSGDYGFFTIGTDGDNSYAGMTVFFTDNTVTFDEAVEFINTIISSIKFK